MLRGQSRTQIWVLDPSLSPFALYLHQSLTLGNHSTGNSASAGQLPWGAPELTPCSAVLGTLQAEDGGNGLVVALERKAGVWGHRKYSPEERGQGGRGRDCMLGKQVGWSKVLPMGGLAEAPSRTFCHHSPSTCGGPGQGSQAVECWGNFSSPTISISFVCKATRI